MAAEWFQTRGILPPRALPASQHVLGRTDSKLAAGRAAAEWSFAAQGEAADSALDELRALTHQVFRPFTRAPPTKSWLARMLETDPDMVHTLCQTALVDDESVPEATTCLRFIVTDAPTAIGSPEVSRRSSACTGASRNRRGALPA